MDIVGNSRTSVLDAGSRPSYDGFLTRYSAAGAVVSVQTLAGLNSSGQSDQDIVSHLGTDASGSLYLGGGYSYQMALGNLTLPDHNGLLSTFVAKYGVSCSQPTANAGADQNACSGNTVTLGGAAAQTGVNYSWSVSPSIAGFSSSQAQPTVQLPAVTASAQYVFTLTATDAQTSVCTASDAVTVTVAPAPTTPSATASPSSIAQGQSATLSVSNVQSGVSYTWSGPGLQTTTGSSVTATPPSTGAAQYTVTATNASNCTATAQASVSVAAAPVLTSFSPTYVKPGDAITITGQNLQGLTQLTFNGAPQTSFTVSSDGTQITTTVPGPDYQLNGNSQPVTTGFVRVTTPAGSAASPTRLRIFNVIGYYDASRGYNYPAPQPLTQSLTINNGAQVYLKGSGFLGATGATFQAFNTGCGSVSSFVGTPAVLNDSMLYVVFQYNLAGFVNPYVTLNITTPAGTLASYGSPRNPYFANLLIGTPFASCLTPASGPAGTRVTLNGNWTTGSGAGATGLTFNGVPGLNFAAGTNNGRQTATADIPPGLSPGVITVQAVGNFGFASNTYLSLPFTLTAQPSITNFTPNNGPTNLTTVTLTGVNLTGATAVSFNGTAASGFTVDATGTQLTVTVPNGATTGPISVTTPQGTGTSTSNFTVTGQGPVISSFAPVFAKSGQTVTITGSNLTGATALRFSGVSQPSFTVNAAGTQLTATVPFANTSASPDLPSGLIQVVTPVGTATSATSLRLLAVTAATVGSSTYPGGLTGDNATISGTGFTGATVAYVLNSITYTVQYTVVSETQITATVPDLSGVSALSGNGGFIVTNTPGLSGANFEVMSPVISSLSPSSGPAGTVVTVTGFNFQRTDPRLGFPIPAQITGVTFNGVAGTNFQLLSPTQARVTVPAGAGTGYVRPAGGPLQEGSSRGLAFTVATPTTANVWTGANSTAWTTASNWSLGTVPVTSNDVIIPAGAARYPVVSTTQPAVASVSVAAGASLSLSNGTLQVLGTLTNNGTITQASGLLEVQGNVVNNGSYTTTGLAPLRLTSTTTAQLLGGSGTMQLFNLLVGTPGATLTGPVQVRGMVSLTSGNLASNGNLTLLSDAQNTGLVANLGSGVVTGNVTVQRYLSPALNAGLGYRHLSSPVSSGATVADLAAPATTPVVNPAYNSAPNPYAVTPFPTVFQYNEQRLTGSGTTADFDYGWESPAATSSPLAVGRGYTSNLSPTTVDFTGPLNNGALPVSLTRGSTAASGWQLLGNPYPSPLNWDNLTRPAGVDNALYVYRSSGQYTGSYVSYVNGVGPAGANIVAMAQGFFARVTTGTSAATLTFTNAARETSYPNPAVYRTQETRPVLALALRRTGSSAPVDADAFYCYQEAGATTGFDSRFDALKVQLNGGQQPTLYQQDGANSFAIQGLPTGSQPFDLTLAVNAPQAGSYTFAPEQLVNFPTSSQLLLEDRLTGTWHDLRQGTYTVQLAQGLSTVRFVLHLNASRPLATTAARLAGATLQVYPNPAAGTSVTLAAAGLPTGSAELRLVNALGQVVRTETLTLRGPLLEQPLAVDKLPVGVYTVQLRTSAGTLTRKLVLH
ncbi:IPT/TIG domain-containing protein [Hymenobacter sp. 15J16-1T3B]|uniref:IPT/TIG domain-containing protein n=1 Tax=Hymenobacter sp. 15J16-1T3B TaxID=2886941 RepID=UPI001D0FC5AC|nr:IPT/TIG domain-containing protein [Hymenobacter sp. 15J16-1T3B]